jgi:hypothetical protein
MRLTMEDDLDLVGAVAAEMVRRWGVDAVRITRDYADLAEETGDALSAEAWGDIADEAERQLRARRQPPISRRLDLAWSRGSITILDRSRSCCW